MDLHPSSQPVLLQLPQFQVIDRNGLYKILNLTYKEHYFQKNDFRKAKLPLNIFFK